MGGWYWITLMVEPGSAWHGQAQSELALVPAGMLGPGMRSCTRQGFSPRSDQRGRAGTDVEPLVDEDKRAWGARGHMAREERGEIPQNEDGADRGDIAGL